MLPIHVDSAFRCYLITVVEDLSDCRAFNINGRYSSGNECPLLVYSVEKLCFSAARKIIGIFRLPGARITDQLCGSESRQAEFSWDFYYPLVSTVRNAAQIANKIAAVFKTEFFNRIGQKRTLTTKESPALWRGSCDRQGTMI